MQDPFTIIIPLLSECTLEKEEERRLRTSLKANHHEKMLGKGQGKRSEMLYNKGR